MPDVKQAYYQTRLQTELSKRCERNARYSLRAFAKSLGFEASVVSQIIAGKRVPSLRTAQRLMQALGLRPDEEQYFLSSLAERHQARDIGRLAPFFRKFATQNIPPKELSLELFRVIADWHHYAILALSLTEGFQPNPRWIASQLGISQAEANLAVERLKELELLEARPDGKLMSTNNGFTTADKQSTNAALKQHQRQVFEKAIISIEEDPIETRNASSMTLAIDPDKLPEAKRRIEAFTQELAAFLESGKKKQVYELGIALYPIQKRRMD